jgi:tetratricopeptide (TPR) repeat protein
MADSFDPSRFEGSVAAFREAIRIDPDDPAAYVALAETYQTMVGATHVNNAPAEMPGLANEAIDRALALDPDDAEALVVKGLGDALGTDRRGSGTEHGAGAIRAQPRFPHRRSVRLRGAGGEESDGSVSQLRCSACRGVRGAGRAADLEQLIASMPKPILDSFWAILAARQGDRETALRYLETFLQHHRPGLG